jgi:tRNA_anti-like
MDGRFRFLAGFRRIRPVNLNPNEKREGNVKRVLVIFVLCCTAFIQLNCSTDGNRSATAPDNSPATPITATELIEAYRMEKADGAGKYKGQRLAVTGTVSRKGKDYLNRLYVDLKTPANSVIEVHCTYNADQEAAMSALKPGQEATIKGVCDGRMSTWVVLKDSVPQ